MTPPCLILHIPALELADFTKNTLRFKFRAVQAQTEEKVFDGDLAVQYRALIV
ncbi:MAG: hypothetical protein JNM39_03120 [Bdellovibrionaceae bacterium]|nr:hypothetical protein [Pseudobdellovibrionaceae bacterium]